MASNALPPSYPTHTPKCVFITGATGGFGTAFAKRFADLGCTLILHGRNEAKLDALIAQLNVPTHKVIFDICNKDQTMQALKALADIGKDIDVLINNAGGALGLDKFHEAQENDIEDMIEMNSTALARITRAILPNMVQAKPILNQASPKQAFQSHVLKAIPKKQPVCMRIRHR